MIGLVRRGGHEVTPDAAAADVLVVNTCGFVSDAKKESIAAILEAAQLKESGRCRRLVVTGCLPERYAEQMRAEFPEVDVLLGTNQVADILRAVDGVAVAPPDSYGKSDAHLYLYDHKTPRILVGAPHAAYVKIAEGCDHACAFCVIPKIRGRFRSRSLPSLLAEARRLAEAGVKEVTLVAQDTTGYGADLGMEDGLADLLAALEKVEGIGWIRFLYAYPDVFSDRLIGVIRDSGKVCRYVDMPLQHASADVLRAMRRGGSRAGLERMVERIRKGIPGVTLRTTFIVGFPGETRRDFLELKNFCRDMEFERMGVFAYSDEEDTAAHGLGPKVSARTAQRRRGVLMEQQEEIAAKQNRRLAGKEFKVLVEGPSEESDLLLQGRMESQAPEIDGVCLINDSDVEGVAAGDFRIVRVTEAMGHDLLCTIVR